MNKVINEIKNKTNKINRDKRVLLTVLLLMLVLTIGASFAFYRYVRLGNTNIALKSGNIEFSFLDGDSVTLKNAFPISDKIGAVDTNNMYRFNVSMKSSVDATSTYSVGLVSNNTGTNNFKNNEIKYNLMKNDEYVVGSVSSGYLLSSLDGFDSEVSNGRAVTLNDQIITSGSTDKYVLRIWIDENVDYSGEIDSNGTMTGTKNSYTYSLKVNITSNSSLANLEYAMNSTMLDENNQVTVRATEQVKNIITISSDNKTNSNYVLYYKPVSSETLPDNVIVGYSEDTKNLTSGIIGVGETKEVTVSIKNNSTEDVTLEFGVIGSTGNVNVSDIAGIAITNQISNDDIILAYTYTGENDPGHIPEQNSGYHIGNVTCDGSDGVWSNTNWSIALSNIKGRTVSCNLEVLDGNYCDYENGHSWEYNYTGSIQSFETPCKGIYEFEAYGAQGGNGGGYGGYSVGYKIFEQNDVIYAAVGGSGGISYSGGTVMVNGGYNGGGGAGAGGQFTTSANTGSGGGATSLASMSGTIASIGKANLDKIYIIAGGGGGRYDKNGTVYGGGSGGGTNGGNGTNAGGTQTTGAGFGVGATQGDGNRCGGGGGLYGGYGSGIGSAGGGSGYIGNLPAFAYDNINYSSSMSNGQRSGNGYAKITLIKTID